MKKAKKKIKAYFDGYITEVFKDTFGFQADDRIKKVTIYGEIKKSAIRKFDRKNIIPGKYLCWIIWKENKKVKDIFKFRRFKPFTDEEYAECIAKAQKMIEELDWQMSKVQINKKLFQVSEGKSFDKFIKEVESTRNDSNPDRDALLKQYLKVMYIDKIDWRKLK